MKARIKWLDNMSFVGESGSGHSIVMDGAEETGGRNLAARPMEMVLMGMGGCTAFDVVMILKRARQPIDDCIIELSAERSEEIPKVFTRIHVHYIVKGRGLSEKQVEKAINLTAEKYCSVSIMLAATAEISHDFEIVEE
ncbi:Protein YhfA [hydrothermal vent metagenome]|uniref:Protein YhfA n=1 Tax=hydrothermal vent metagenome TaxID=652676 RepID=A0A3B0Y4E2_9ZZZZ